MRSYVRNALRMSIARVDQRADLESAEEGTVKNIADGLTVIYSK